MDATRTLGPAELAAATGDVVPQRDTLALVNLANLVSVNVALAVNAATINSSAYATAGQALGVAQF